MHPLDDPHAGHGGREGLRETTAVWEAHAQADPLWAVLSDPVRAGRRWDLDTFLESGRHQVDQALGRLDALGGTLVDHDWAVDFGSGVGRLSQALGDRFERVLGLDVSPTMVAVARRLNRHGDRVTFRCNDSDRLEGVASGSVSLALSFITLQHVPPALARAATWPSSSGSCSLVVPPSSRCPPISTRPSSPQIATTIPSTSRTAGPSWFSNYRRARSGPGSRPASGSGSPTAAADRGSSAGPTP